jgi:hypothetical protein
MMRRMMTAAIVMGSVAAVAPVSAQSSCTGTGSCAVTSTASVAIPALVSLDVAGAGAITLTPPTVADLATGYVQDAGPAITVKANRTWTLSVHTTATTNWTYSGTEGGVKPIGDLTWSNTAGGTYAAITNSAAAVVTAQAKTNAGAPTVFFRTVYSSDFSANRNSVGSYSIPVVFTISAP